MRRIARGLILASVAFVLAFPLAGCQSSTNEGTAPPDAPKSQKEFYEQQKAAAEAAGAGKTKSKKK